MMTNATSMVPVHDGDLFAAEPIVWVDGERRTDLALGQLTILGPTDERTAVIVPAREAGSLSPDEAHRIASLAGAAVRVAQPVDLGGGESRLMPLFDGRFDAQDRVTNASTDRASLAARDTWSYQLDRPVPDGAPAQPMLEAIAALNEASALGLGAGPLEPAAALSTTGPWADGASLRDVLRSVLADAGAFVRQDAQGDRSVVSAGRGRLSRLPLHDTARSSLVSGIDAHTPHRVATRLTGGVGRQVVESTFDLLPGWDAADQDAADTEYARSTSSDFDAYANVFRLWLLNEDASLAAPGFDLTQLFADGRSYPPTPIRFGRALALDGAGRSVGVVVETSVDAGATWRRYGGPTVVLNDRAGVQLDDDALDPAWLTAVRQGQAKLRVTATLTSPLPTEVVRWHGNPFAGPFERERIDLSDRFAWRRVHGASRFAAEVASGQRSADTRDDRAAAALWLAERAAERSSPGGARTVELPLTLGLAIGDRVAVPGSSAGGRSAVTRITHDWRRRRTTLRLTQKGGGE